jgi:N-methylhydantoinase B
MCRRRIRVPETWYGDHLAAVGAARVGERRVQEFFAKYGVALTRRFIRDWFDYSERITIKAIGQYASGTVSCEVRHDPVEPVLPEGLLVRATYTLDAEAGLITVDQRDNPDCLDAGMNLTEATAFMGTAQGIFNCLGEVPYNSGTLRRIRILLRDGCCVGIPRHPHSCSCGTAPMVDLLVNMAQYAMAQLGDGGMSEGNWSNSGGAATISGYDRRRDQKFVDQIFLMGGGGPATRMSDGMAYYLIPPGAGLLYRDSVEINEQRFPFLIRCMRTIPDSCGAGTHRGGPGTELIYGPRFDAMGAINITNGQVSVPRGVRGGGNGSLGGNEVWRRDGTREVMPAFMRLTMQPGDMLRALDQGGGGFGPPTRRDPQRVLRDVEDQLISLDSALSIYGVIFTGTLDDDTLAVDAAATEAERARRP